MGCRAGCRGPSLARAKGSLKLVLGSAWLTQTGKQIRTGGETLRGEERALSFSLVLYLTSEERRRKLPRAKPAHNLFHAVSDALRIKKLSEAHSQGAFTQQTFLRGAVPGPVLGALLHPVAGP